MSSENLGVCWILVLSRFHWIYTKLKLNILGLLLLKNE